MNDRTGRDVAATQVTRVFDTMGTTVSLVLHGRLTADRLEEVVGQVAAVFTAADARYSLYRPESELSCICRGDLRLPDASGELRHMYDLAIDWRNKTNGAFTPHPGDGSIDLSGVVKSWAIAQAGTILRKQGLHCWCINAGGDVLTSGHTGKVPWIVGIINPAERTALMASVRMSQALPALATSGSAERGEHIWTHTQDAGGRFAQVSVLGPDIITADVLATAIIAGGQDTLNLATSSWPVDVLVIDKEGDMLATPGFSALLAT